MLNYNQKYIICDVESRNLNLHVHNGGIPNCNYPWEVAWIECSGEFTQNEFQYFVDVPSLNLSPLVRTLTHFNENKYNNLKQPPKFAWNKLKKYLYDEDYLIIGQNILGFDIFLIGILANMVGEKIDWSFIDRIIDTRALGLAHKNGLEKPRNGSLIQWQYKILNDPSLKGRVSQTALLKEFNLESIDEGARHSGIVDVKDTFRIFCELKKKLKL